MLRSLNYTKIQCLECKEWFEIQPNKTFDKVTCDCKEAKQPKQRKSNNAKH